MTTGASKHAIQGAPPKLEAIGERQRQRDATRAEIDSIKHRAREPLASGYPITCKEGEKEWPMVYAWIQSLVGIRGREASKLVLLRQTVGADDSWRVEVSSKLGILFRDVIPTARFLDTWKG